MPQDLSSEQDPDDSDVEFVEVDPTGRYGRYKEILGRGAFKKVYRAFDELEGIEVAWNQVKVADLLRNSEDLERLYSEVHLLKTLKHKNIIKFYNSWVDTKHENINFITEIFTSGTLRQYRKKHKYVDLRALKKWSRQILEGLMYLHSHDPPVIHRDLKCDNIFVNGNQGEVKIGDLGLAAILRQARSAHSVIGTPEFMAPELYEEEYNELVDIYAFGMCLLELVTFEYPYVECANAAQIYKKVTSGIKPASLAKVTDPGVRLFIEKCIAKVSDRLTAMDLLMDPFLHSGEDLGSIYSPIQFNAHDSEGIRSQIDGGGNDKDLSTETSRDFMVQGQRKDINTIFLKLRIADPSGHIRNIHFPFDIEADTAIAVASEMVEELDLTDQDVSTISEMIDTEIGYHIPNWRPKDFTGEISRREIPSNDNCVSEVKIDASLSNECRPSSSNLALERLPSGRKYWSDSPMASNEKSPVKLGLSNLSAPTVNLVAEEDSFILDNENSPSSHNNEDNPDGFASHEQPEHVSLCLDESGVETAELAYVQTDNKIDDGEKRLLRNGAYPLFEEIESGDVKIIAQDLEILLLEQQKELDELKKKHQSEILDIVKELSPETRVKVFDICKARVHRC